MPARCLLRVIHRPESVRFGVGFCASGLMLSASRRTQKALIHRLQTAGLAGSAGPKTQKAPSLGLRWQEHCYTVASVLQCPAIKSKTGQSLGTLNLFLGLRTELPQESDVRSLEPDCSDPCANSHTDLYVWRASGANLHDLHHSNAPTRLGLRDASAVQRDLYTLHTQRQAKAGCDGVEAGARPRTQLPPCWCPSMMAHEAMPRLRPERPRKGKPEPGTNAFFLRRRVREKLALRSTPHHPERA